MFESQFNLAVNKSTWQHVLIANPANLYLVTHVMELGNVSQDFAVLVEMIPMLNLPFMSKN